MAIIFTVVLIIATVDASAQFLKRKAPLKQLGEAIDLRKIGIMEY